MRFIGKTILWLMALLGSLVTVGIIGGIVMLMNYHTPVPEISKNTVLWLDLTHPVTERRASGGFFGEEGNTTLLDQITALEKAADDPNVIAVATELGGHGMGLAQIQELRAALLRFQQNSGKKAYIYAEDLGGLGNGTLDYYLASAFSEIWLSPTGGVGINGLAIEIPYFADALANIDVQAEMEQRHEFKGGADPFIRSRMTAPIRQASESLLLEWQDQIMDDIHAAKPDIPSNTTLLMAHSPYLPAESIKLRLVDKLAYLPEFYDMIVDLAEDGSYVDEVSLPYYLAAIDTKEESSEEEDSQARIAIIHGTGPITPEDFGEGYFTDESFSPYTVASLLEEAREDPSIDAVLFRVSSPGGAYGQSDMVRHEVLKYKDEGKPIIVSMGDYAASGGYFVSMGADHIMANRATLTGSIGVYAGKFSTKKLWEKLGVNWEQISTAPQAGMWSMVHEFSPSQLKKFQESLDFVYDDFTGKAALDRQLNAVEIDTAARGRVWTGDTAIQVRLVDSIGGYHEALSLLRDLLGQPENATLETIILPKPPTTFEQIQAIFSNDNPLQFISTQISQNWLRTNLPDWVQHIKTQFAQDGLLMMPPYQISP